MKGKVVLLDDRAEGPLNTEDIAAINFGVRQAKQGLARPLKEVMARIEQALDRA